MVFPPLVHHKIMKVMELHEGVYVLGRKVQVDDAYLGGELNGGKAGRGSENKLPIVASVSTDRHGHPLQVKLSPANWFHFLGN